MDGILFPVFFINTVIFSVKIKLIHAEGNRNIFWLPLFLVGILIYHSQFFHDLPAPGIFYVMGSGDERHAGIPQFFHYRPAGFCYDALMPEVFSQAIAEIMAFAAAYLDITDGNVISL